MPSTRLGHLAAISLADIEFGLGPALEQIVRAATDLLPATKGASVVVWDPERESFTEGASTVSGQQEFRPDQHVRRSGGTSRRIIDNRQSVVVPDTSKDSSSANTMVSDYKVGAYAGIPLLDGTTCVGVLYALEDDPHDFTDDDVAFLEALAGRAAEAIVHTRFLEDARAARARAEAIAQATHDMLAAHSVSDVSDAALLAVGDALETGDPVLAHVDAVTGKVLGGRQLDHGRLVPMDEIGQVPPLPMPNEAPRVLDDGRIIGRLPFRGRSTAILVVHRSPDHVATQDDIDFVDVIVSTAALAMENLALLEEVGRLAETDHLTGIANRRQFDTSAAAAIDAARVQSRALSVAMLDADHFKTINDTLGHVAGDEVLIEIASRLSASVRTSDLVARYGGEEFVVLLRDTSISGAALAGERLREAIADAPFQTSVGEVTVTISVGVATMTDSTIDSDMLCSDADVALYEAKHAGRNQVVCATTT